MEIRQVVSKNPEGEMLKRIFKGFGYLASLLLVGCAVSILAAWYFGFNIFEVIFWMGIVFTAAGAVLGLSSDPRMQGDCLANLRLLISLDKQGNYSCSKPAGFKPKASSKYITLAGILLVFSGYFLK